MVYLEKCFALRHQFQKQVKPVLETTKIDIDLKKHVNLFCCTTTGILGSAYLKNSTFDTLIVDEASRVTDTEFLIGATKSRRWILVGDEHQLPPYVDNQDEYFLHALSAIYRSETRRIPLQESIEQLAEIWQEDDELHQYRKDAVLQEAEKLLTRGQWSSVYKEIYLKGLQRVQRYYDDPETELLKSLHQQMVQSLFERCVKIIPAEFRQRLIEQRRMIEPIARIVKDSVYEGSYKSPDTSTLIRQGIVPLTTTTFKTPISFIDTSNFGSKAKEENKGFGFINKLEAELTIKACLVLDEEIQDFKPVTVSILCFYKAQASLIQKKLQNCDFKKIQFAIIDTIDGIQGQESDVVFINFCRTSDHSVPKNFGQWLQDLRRLNVACTRAHRALVFVGHSQTLKRLQYSEHAMKFYRDLFDLFKTNQQTMTIFSQFGELVTS